MKIIRLVSLFCFLILNSVGFGQENSGIPQRTPEQEAQKQTEKLQQELNLTAEQSKQIYEINLRYARERQISKKRSEAVERMKNKNSEIQQILSNDQNEKLQSKRYERNTETGTNPQNRPVNSSFRANQDNRANPSVRITVPEINMRSGFRPSNPTVQKPAEPTVTSPQSTRRSTPTDQSQPNVRSNPSAVRPSLTVPSTSFRRSESPTNSSKR